MLTQSDNSGLDRVISYASRALTNREKGFSITEKEALAIVFATDHFRPYLLGRKFEVVTDHSALRWLHSVEPKGRLAREDTRLKTVIDLKSSGMPKPPLFVWRHNSILKALWHCWDSLYIVDGMLVKSDNPEKLLPEYSFVIPSQLVLSVLQGIHSSPFAGHLV